MSLRLYFDEDSVDHALVRGLRARGVDVVTAIDVDMAGQEDQQHVQFAKAQSRVLCTYNASDFYRIHTELVGAGRSHAGMVLAPQQRYSVGEHLRRLLRLMAAHSTESMRDHVEFLSAWG